ncbi:hypothetical protein Tco_1200471 [Tanacetum coccineum]
MRNLSRPKHGQLGKWNAEMGENGNEEVGKGDTVVGIIKESGVHSNFTSWSLMQVHRNLAVKDGLPRRTKFWHRWQSKCLSVLKSKKSLVNLTEDAKEVDDRDRGMDLNAFIRTADPRKELSASVEREFAGDASVGDGGDQGFDSAAGTMEESVGGAGADEIYVPEVEGDQTVPGWIRNEQLFTEFNVSAARNLSLNSEDKNTLLEAKDKEIEDLKSQLLRAREDSAEVTQLRAQVSGLEASKNSLRGEVASSPPNDPQTHLLEQEWTRLAEIDADFTRCCMRLQEYSHPPPPQLIAGSKMDDFNSAIRELRDLNFPLLQELSNKKDASNLDNRTSLLSPFG